MLLVVPVVEVHHDDDEEEEVVAASPEGGEEESPVVERDEVSEDQGSSCRVVFMGWEMRVLLGIVEEAVEEKAGVDEQGEGGMWLGGVGGGVVWTLDSFNGQ